MLLWVFSYNIPDAYRYTEVEPYLSCDMVIDDATSVLWCERYTEPGEFVTKIRATPELLSYFWTHKTLIARQDTDRVMVTDRILMTTSAEDGDYITISGKSAEGLTGRRIISQKGSISGMNAAAALRYYMQENIASWWYYHEDADHQHGRHNPYSRRYINLLRYGQDDERITRDISAEPFGKNLGAFIADICKGSDFGFKVTFDGQAMSYSFYMGDDRSLNQSELPAVVFSEDFQNLGDTEYEWSSETYASHAIAGGSGTGQERIERDFFRSFRYPDGAGMNLREIFVDASSTSDEMVGTAAQEACFAAQETVNFTGEILPTGQYEYRRDYFLGDRVSVVNRYGISGVAIVTEVVETEDESGYKVIPTLGTFDVSEYIEPEKPVKPEPPYQGITIYPENQEPVQFDNFQDAYQYLRANTGIWCDITIGNMFASIPSDAFPSWARIGYVSIFDGVTTIENRAFYQCTSIKSITLPNTIETIGEYAFYWCEKITQLIIPGSVRTIGKQAFTSCRNLETVVMNRGITEIPIACFMDCEKLLEITIPDTITTIGASTFYQCYALTVITIQKPQDSIPGAPWEAPNATVVWTG